MWQKVCRKKKQTQSSVLKPDAFRSKQSSSSLASMLRYLQRSIYSLYAATNRCDKTLEELQSIETAICAFVVSQSYCYFSTAFLQICDMITFVNHNHCMDTNNYLNTDDYKFRIALHTGVMFLYLLEMHVLVLFLTDFPNPELYSSVLCFQFLILESTKQVVIATAIGIFIHFNNIYKLVHLQ